MTDVLAVVPARGGSKGIPRKNLRSVGGKPLVAHQIESAIEAPKIDRTILSTDDEKIAAVGEKYGAEVPFIRPENIATDDVPVIAAYKHAMEWFDEYEASPKYVVGLQPTCPFTKYTEVNTAVKKIQESDCDSVVTVARVTETHPYRAYTIDDDRLKSFEDITISEPLQRQDRPDAYGLTGAIFVRHRSMLDAWDYDDLALGDDVRTIIQTEEQTLDIDTPFELRMARALFEYGGKNDKISTR